MADIADIANDHNEMMLNAIVANRKPVEIKHYAVCRNCLSTENNGNQFCDKDCQDDFEKRNKGG